MKIGGAELTQTYYDRIQKNTPWERYAEITAKSARTEYEHTPQQKHDISWGADR